MSIGLLIAILVTANMVPETFEPGSLNLLLSKPISRWGLYTAKFVGGCVFIALCAGYLFLGVWVWLGLAMEVWDRAILLSIPLYVIVFAIYFSVSAFVGLLWRRRDRLGNSDAHLLGFLLLNRFGLRLRQYKNEKQRVH